MASDLNRWRIKGILATDTPLHIGDGNTIHHPELTVSDSSDEKGETKKLIEISSVATDSSGRAYIPGVTLKGNLRSWLTLNQTEKNLVESVFGWEDQNDDQSKGGKAEFCDAYSVEESGQMISVPYWRTERLTGVTASVAIDRPARTASYRRLFHEEFVPQGIRFQIIITGQDLEDDEVGLLLFALNGFNNQSNPVTIGADTGNGWGRFTWTATPEISCFTKDNIQKWLESKAPAIGYAALEPLSSERQAELLLRAGRFAKLTPPSVKLTLRLDFDGPFMVNDPSQVETGRERTERQEREENKNEKPGHAPLRDPQGNVQLPARSIRGAFRSQAEKIVRTFNPEAACPGDGGPKSCRAIYEAGDVGRLCLTCQLFGAPGWRSTVDFSAFEQVGACEWQMPRQYFVSIDRFTGGAAPQRLFNAEPVYKPALKGTMSLGMSRKYVDEEGKSKEWRPEPWALGLLALTLRDLMEGDISLGFGAAKGYGACRAIIEKAEFPGLDAESRMDLLELYDVTGLGLDSFNVNEFDWDEANLALSGFIDAFSVKVTGFKLGVSDDHVER